MTSLGLLTLRFWSCWKTWRLKSLVNHVYHMQTRRAIKTHIASMDVSIPRVSMANRWISIVIGRGATKGGIRRSNRPRAGQVTCRWGWIVPRQRLIRFETKSRGPLSVLLFAASYMPRLRLYARQPHSSTSGEAISHSRNGVTAAKYNAKHRKNWLWLERNIK